MQQRFTTPKLQNSGFDLVECSQQRDGYLRRPLAFSRSPKYISDSALVYLHHLSHSSSLSAEHACVQLLPLLLAVPPVQITRSRWYPGQQLERKSWPTRRFGYCLYRKDVNLLPSRLRGTLLGVLLVFVLGLIPHQPRCKLHLGSTAWWFTVER